MFREVAEMKTDADLLGRITACAALERITNPDLWVQWHAWDIVGRSDWAEAWAYAQAQGTTELGATPAVITDQMILSAVQEVRSQHVD